MKKTAIVSCYFFHNYGSMLQAYATQKALDKLGVDNETINVSGFLPALKKKQIRYLIGSMITSGILSAKFGKLKNIIIKKIIKSKYTENIGKRDRKFEEFAKATFRLSDKYQSVGEVGKACDRNYSAVLVGSDQLWLPGNIAADYYTLNFVSDKINTISYATSFGVSSLPTDIQKKAKSFLKRIRHISVREQSGQEIIRDITERSVPIVCDPTLLFTGEEWMDIQKEESIIEGAYIFCYFIGKNQEHRSFARQLKEHTGLKIVSLTHIDEYVKCDDKYADETPFDIGPADFLNLIRNARYVCTDSFHCCTFSILYKKEFFAFRRFANKSKQSTNSRLDTLFDLTGIKGRIMKSDEDIDNCLKHSIDYDLVDKKLKSVRKASFAYLMDALKDERSTDF